jgi:hypothetical protein
MRGIDGTGAARHFAAWDQDGALGIAPGIADKPPVERARFTLRAWPVSVAQFDRQLVAGRIIGSRFQEQHAAPRICR